MDNGYYDQFSILSNQQIIHYLVSSIYYLIPKNVNALRFDYFFCSLKLKVVALHSLDKSDFAKKRTIEKKYLY